MTEIDNNLRVLWGTVLHDHVQTSFERLADADVAKIDGDADKFLPLLEERYGYTPKQAEEAMNTFLNRYNTFDNSKAGAVAAHEGHNPNFSEVY